MLASATDASCSVVSNTTTLAHQGRRGGVHSITVCLISALGPCPSGEPENRLAHRVGRTRGIEILAEERDLAAAGMQEKHLILAIDPPRGLDEALRLDLGDGPFRIGEGVHREVEEAEILHGSQEPGHMTHHLLPSR